SVRRMGRMPQRLRAWRGSRTSFLFGQPGRSRCSAIGWAPLFGLVVVDAENVQQVQKGVMVFVVGIAVDGLQAALDREREFGGGEAAVRRAECESRVAGAVEIAVEGAAAREPGAVFGGLQVDVRIHGKPPKKVPRRLVAGAGVVGLRS